ncbi:hypothetical protein [Edaphocola aurantiacus]|uniref:hypothetical protein n=1 Tax=Edaphocola aurantiacus TaxID=2601682 RepID=UPI001C95055B|nr:hypothetical protein [Edaphocola aurantiacus]
MKAKTLNILLVLTSIIGYLEWGKDASVFFFQAELQILNKLFTDPQSVLHPLILLPLAGQLLLLFTLFQKKVSPYLTYFGMAAIALLILFMGIVGLISSNISIVISSIPFVVTGIATIRYYRYSRVVATA